MADVITRHFSSRRKSSLEGRGGIGMALHLGLPHSHRHSAEQQQEIREAKRFLKESVRSDWVYPGLPEYDGTVRGRVEKEEETDGDGDAAASGDEVAERIAGFKLHSSSNHDRGGVRNKQPEDLLFEPVQWRERDYSTDASSDDESDGSNDSKKSNYKFDGPDSVGVQISDSKQARKRKRQERLDEEVTWNDGLAHWLARRDVWCGAHTPEQVRMLETKRQVSTTDSSSASAHSTPRTSTSSSSDEELAASEATNTPSTTPEPVPSGSEPTLSPMKSPAVASSSEILVPVAPPLLPNHPIRRRITPDVYPEIYSKIIVQSRSPSVPINLRTMTRALVQGWKDDGEWPPKQAPPEKSIGRRRGKGEESTLKSGVKAVGRVLRITGGDGSGGKDKEKG